MQENIFSRESVAKKFARERGLGAPRIAYRIFSRRASNVLPRAFQRAILFSPKWLGLPKKNLDSR